MGNARSVVNKRIQIETFIYKQKLDIVRLTETWLTPEVNSWEFRGFITYRRDRLGGRRGWVAILCKRELMESNCDIVDEWSTVFEVMAIQIRTSLGEVLVVTQYVQPTLVISADTWREYFYIFGDRISC